jgi:pimeloyl-ACP methyl ester carboxylesterase
VSAQPSSAMTTYFRVCDGVRALDARANISAAVETGAPRETEPEAHEDYVSAYDLGRFAESARFVRHYPEQNKVLADLLPQITTPAQVVAGAHHDLVPWSNNQYLADVLPHAEIHPLEAGHFAWEETPEEYGRLVADWISGGYRRPLARSSRSASTVSTPRHSRSAAGDQASQLNVQPPSSS